jgi:hypothetical protein
VGLPTFLLKERLRGPPTVGRFDKPGYNPILPFFGSLKRPYPYQNDTFSSGVTMKLICIVLCLAGTLVLTTLAHAADVSVDCSGTNKKKLPSITAALASIPKVGPNTIHISGTCNEAVVVDGLDRLTMVGDGTASINDPNPQPPDLEDTAVLSINNSDHIEVQNITVNGGAEGIQCAGFSVCRLTAVHVQNSVATGVQFVRSYGFIFDDSVIENNAGVGLAATAGSNVNVIPLNTSTNPIIRTNGVGIQVADNSHVQTVATVQNNSADGIQVFRGSNIRLLVGTVVSGNGGRGVFLRDSSGLFSQSSIIGNTGSGVNLGPLSFAQFSGTTVSGNGSPDVNCASVTAATTGATTVGGATNCTEPAP